MDLLNFVTSALSQTTLSVRPGVVGILLLLAAFLVRSYAKGLHRRAPLPPGPKPLPLIGNIYDLPGEYGYDWLHWEKHRDLYGPISQVSVLGTSIIILNDLQLSIDMLNKRSSIYSDRPTTVMNGKLYSVQFLSIALSN